jgi:hypothetical protein
MLYKPKENITEVKRVTDIVYFFEGAPCISHECTVTIKNGFDHNKKHSFTLNLN